MFGIIFKPAWAPVLLSVCDRLCQGVVKHVAMSRQNCLVHLFSLVCHLSTFSLIFPTCWTRLKSSFPRFTNRTQWRSATFPLL